MHLRKDAEGKNIAGKAVAIELISLFQVKESGGVILIATAIAMDQ